MSKNQLNYDEIKDQHLDTMISLAFKHADALETQEIMEECEHAECPVDEKRVKATYDMFLDKLAKQEAQERKQSRIVRFRRSIPRVIQIAACLVLVLGIATPFAVANVEVVRVRIMELLIDIQEDHAELIFVEDEDAEFYVPADWQGNYYPSYIPAGFNLVEQGEFTCYVRYQDNAGQNIYFTEYNESDTVNINSENAALSYSEINGHDVFVIERDDMVIAAWAVEDRYIVMETELPKDEALNLVQNVRRISQIP